MSMNKTLSAVWETDGEGNRVLHLCKKRGNLSLNEIVEYLRQTGNGAPEGRYALIFNASDCDQEHPDGGGGAPPQGDSAYLYPLKTGQPCPICRLAISSGTGDDRLLQAGQ